VDVVVRRLPAQDRSAQRVNLILDTAAQLIDEHGLSAVTPTAIARRSGMTGPAIYRYFADAESILHALAGRNLERFFAAQESVVLDPQLTWNDAVATAVENCAELFRSEPGFARLGIGEALDRDVRGLPYGHFRTVALAVVAQFQPRDPAWDRPMMVEHIEVVGQVVFVLLGRAFDTDPNGDPFFIAEAKRFGISYVADVLGTPHDTHPASTA
jgi:AcrR family transcriptional regulator